MAEAGDPKDESIGELLGRLAEDGRAYVKAGVGVYRAIAARRMKRARNGLIALAIGIVLMICSVTAMLLGLVLWLATLIGPLWAGLAVAAALLLTGFLLVRVGIGGLKALGGDEAEREALARGDDRE
ncbi:phage holin family protein [Allosphingosinicella sp.]|uniref:phage holin family protein n=1 Tax=Allosphingosinicella sp. TaxID=2823234 RepID=UPI00378357F5